MTSPVTITQSKNKNGELTLGATDGIGGVSFACQATNVRITPTVGTEGEATETLCGATLGTDDTITYALTVGAIQDFDDPEGFQAYTWENKLTVVEFTWKPNPNAPTYSGRCKVIPAEVGGEVNRRLTTEVTFPIEGDVSPSYAPTSG